MTMSPTSSPHGIGGKEKYTLDAYFPYIIPFLRDKRRKYSALLGHFLFNNSHLRKMPKVFFYNEGHGLVVMLEAKKPYY